MKQIALISVLMFASMSLSGCLLGVAAGAGAVGYDEATEKDGEFDPLEKAYDGDDSTGVFEKDDNDDD